MAVRRERRTRTRERERERTDGFETFTERRRDAFDTTSDPKSVKRCSRSARASNTVGRGARAATAAAGRRRAERKRHPEATTRGRGPEGGAVEAPARTTSWTRSTTGSLETRAPSEAKKRNAGKARTFGRAPPRCSRTTRHKARRKRLTNARLKRTRLKRKERRRRARTRRSRDATRQSSLAADSYDS